ncbi:Antitoxin CcdA, partial [Klebsiella pneumoniae]
LLQQNVYFMAYLKYVKKRCIVKQRITVTVDSDSYQLLKAYDVNISGLVSTTMQNEARRLRAERWQEENREGMAEVASFIEANGSFADENRDW